MFTKSTLKTCLNLGKRELGSLVYGSQQPILTLLIPLSKTGSVPLVLKLQFNDEWNATFTTNATFTKATFGNVYFKMYSELSNI